MVLFLGHGGQPGLEPSPGLLHHRRGSSALLPRIRFSIALSAANRSNASSAIRAGPSGRGKTRSASSSGRCRTSPPAAVFEALERFDELERCRLAADYSDNAAHPGVCPSQPLPERDPVEWSKQPYRNRGQSGAGTELTFLGSGVAILGMRSLRHELIMLAS